MSPAEISFGSKRRGRWLHDVFFDNLVDQSQSVRASDLLEWPLREAGVNGRDSVVEFGRFMLSLSGVQRGLSPGVRLGGDQLVARILKYQ